MEKPTDQHLTVEPLWPVERVVRAVRAATPEPGALLGLDGRTWAVRGVEPGPPPPPGARPGDVFQADGQAFLVVQDGSVRFLSVVRVDEPREGSLEDVLGLTPGEEPS